MVDLEAIQKKIDKVWENETPEGLSNWLFNKRFVNVNKIVGEGKFVSIQQKPIEAKFTSDPDANSFLSDNEEYDPIPPNRLAA